MPTIKERWDTFIVKLFAPSISLDEPDGVAPKGMKPTEDAIAMDSFRRRVSTASGIDHHQKAVDFDYMHWKPRGKRRRRYHVNEFPKQCKQLSTYVKAVAYTGYIGLEEKRWAGIGLEPAPLGTRRPGGTNPGSLQGSRDILAKMGSAPTK